MKTYRNSINGITFIAAAEEKLYPQVQILFQSIEEVPFENIKNGYLLEIGFTVFTLVEKDGVYIIFAPDYKNNPFTDTVEDLTAALRIQSQQIDLLKSYNIKWENIRFDDKIIVAKNALQENHIFMQRNSDCNKGDSGWCVKSVDNDETDDADNYEAFYVYQLLELRPELLKVLAFPYDYIIVFEGDVLKAILNEQDEDIMTD